MLFSLRLFFPLTVPVSDFYASHDNYLKYIKYTWYSLNFFLFQTYTNNLIYKLRLKLKEDKKTQATLQF